MSVAISKLRLAIPVWADAVSNAMITAVDREEPIVSFA